MDIFAPTTVRAILEGGSESITMTSRMQMVSPNEEKVKLPNYSRIRTGSASTQPVATSKTNIAAATIDTVAGAGVSFLINSGSSNSDEHCSPHKRWMRTGMIG